MIGLKHSKFPILFIVGFFILTCCSPGCISISKGSQSENIIGKGFTETSIEPIHFSGLSEAIDTIALYQNTNYSIRYIRGENLDLNGLAQRWIIGIKTQSTSNFIIYENSGITIIPWKSWMPKQEIIVEKILTPDELLKSQSLIISNVGDNSTQTNLEIFDEDYHISFISGKSVETLCFDTIKGNQKNC